VGRGLGNGVHGCDFFPVGTQCVPLQAQDDGLGKPKLSISIFEGDSDVEEYLTWELNIEKLWRLHENIGHRKMKLASSEFDGYVLRWWGGIVCAREEDGDPYYYMAHHEGDDASLFCSH
jgi:hypothetical protein